MLNTYFEREHRDTSAIINKLKDKIIVTEQVQQQVFSYLDLTTLEPEDNPLSVKAWLDKINSLPKYFPNYSLPAGVCVYPLVLPIVREQLKTSNIQIVAVAGGFPASQTFTQIKVEECCACVAEGAQELDIVLSVGRFLAKDFTYASNEIAKIKNTSKVFLKVILETGCLETPEAIRRAAFLAMDAGADMIKTSTGKAKIGATPEAFWVMAESVKDYYTVTKRKVGLKAAGGIRKADEAILYMEIVREVLGESWLTPSLFRIGAGGLANQLLNNSYF